MNTILVYLIILAMGFVIVLLAFLIKESWRIKPAEVKIQKLGVELKVQNNTLIMMLGVLLLVGSGYFLFQSDKTAIREAGKAKIEAERIMKETQAKYEDQIRNLEQSYAKAVREVREIMLKEYQLQLNMVFEGVDKGSELDNINFYQYVDISVSVTPPSGKEEIVTGKELETGEKGTRLQRLLPYGIKLVLEKLRLQDRVVLIATYDKDGKKYSWRGEMVLPTVDLKLYQLGR